jgi:hypothetical protein
MGAGLDTMHNAMTLDLTPPLAFIRHLFQRARPGPKVHAGFFALLARLISGRFLAFGIFLVDVTL